MIRIIDIPSKFYLDLPFSYPPHQGNSPMIEKKSFDFFSSSEIHSDYIYIPIQWTAFHLSNDYGKNLEELAEYCSNIVLSHPDEKFFTVVQYDGGTLIPIDNCVIFASSGNFNSPIGNNSYYEPIPLLCNSHTGIKYTNKEYKVGYIGRNTHPIRKKMFDILGQKESYCLKNDNDYQDTETFKNILCNSIFALCPRGYGPTSYRLYESIQMGCIPIYISDEFWTPFTDEIEWSKMCLLINENEIETIPEKVDYLIDSGEYKNFLNYGQKVYKKYLTWEGCLSTIARKVC